VNGSQKQREKTNIAALMGFWKLGLVDVSVCWKISISDFGVVGCWKYKVIK